jgi:hypothetical protein
MSILGKILEAVLKPKFEKEANKIINSEEVQSNLKVIAHATDEIIKDTKLMKSKINDYNKSIKSMQDAGIKVKTGDTPAQMNAAYDEWQKERNEVFAQKHPNISPQLMKEFLPPSNLSENSKVKGFIGEKCLYCNSVISSKKSNQFCSVKCEKEYTEFKIK